MIALFVQIWVAAPTFPQAGVHKHVPVLKEVADLAARELVIEQAVDSISTQYMGFNIQFVQEKESGIAGRWPQTYVEMQINPS